MGGVQEVGGRWEVDGRRTGGGWGPRKSKNLPSRGIPGRFLSLVLISPNLA